MYTCAYNIDLRNIGLLLIRNLQRQIRTARIIYLVEPDLEYMAYMENMAQLTKILSDTTHQSV